MQQDGPATKKSEGNQSREQTVNVLGVVGLVLSVAGIAGGICMAPFALLSTLGLGVSIVGAFRLPRNLAIAGIVIGLAGTILGAVLLFSVRPADPPGPGGPGAGAPAAHVWSSREDGLAS